MRKSLLLLIFVALLYQICSAANKDSNVVISNAADHYVFKFDKKQKTVGIEQEITVTYKCVDFRTDVPVVEFYDDKTKIESVDIFVSGKKNSKIIPRHEYYSIDNIFYSDARICYFTLPLEKKESSSEVQFKKWISDPRYFTSVYLSEGFKIE